MAQFPWGDEALNACRICNAINDPMKGDQWMKGEDFREQFSHDQRIIQGEVKSVEYCPSCAELLNSNRNFGTNGSSDNGT